MDMEDVMSMATANGVVVAAVVVVSTGIVLKLLCKDDKGTDEGDKDTKSDDDAAVTSEGEMDDEELEMVLEDQRNALIADLQSDELSVLFDEDIQITYEQLDFLLQNASHARVSKSLTMLASSGKSYQKAEAMVEAVVSELTQSRGDTLSLLQREELQTLFNDDQEMTEGDLDDLLITGGGLLRLYYTLAHLVGGDEPESFADVDALLEAVRGRTDHDNDKLCDFLDSEVAKTLLPQGEIVITDAIIDEMIAHNGGVDKLIAQLRVYASEGLKFESIQELCGTVCELITLSTPEEQESFAKLLKKSFTLEVPLNQVDDYVECVGSPTKAEELLHQWKKEKKKIRTLVDLQTAFTQHKAKVVKQIKKKLASEECSAVFGGAEESAFKEFSELCLLNARSVESFVEVVDKLVKDKDKVAKMDDLLQLLAHYEGTN